MSETPYSDSFRQFRQGLSDNGVILSPVWKTTVLQENDLVCYRILGGPLNGKTVVIHHQSNGFQCWNQNEGWT